MIDLFTVDFNGLTNEERYSAIVDLARVQPAESNRHDFKLKWTDEGPNDVAAFANTFGGVLVVGVQKGKKDTTAGIVGVSSASEIATGIASSIATNISPTPSYDIMECYKPENAAIRFCVIRVRADSTIYLVTKKGSPPVWVRNADETIRADAAQLRRMIDREKESAEERSEMLFHRAQTLVQGMPIGHGYRLDAEGQNWPVGSWSSSPTFLKLALVPTERKVITLGQRDELKFIALIHANYRRVQSTLGGVSREALGRSADYFEYRWYHRNLDHETRWRITSSLQFALSTQIREDQVWSLSDVVFNSILFLKIGSAWWESLGYFGDSILYAELAVSTLQPARGQAGQFLTLLNQLRGDFAIGGHSITLHDQQLPAATAGVNVNFPGMRAEAPCTVTSLVNTLLRSLGHSVLLEEFEDNVRVIIRGAF